MALATRCPHCHTTFRVAHDQLKLRAGLVRCGSCKEIFNGIEHLLPQQAAGTTPAPATAQDHAPDVRPAASAAVSVADGDRRAHRTGHRDTDSANPAAPPRQDEEAAAQDLPDPADVVLPDPEAFESAAAAPGEQSRDAVSPPVDAAAAAMPEQDPGSVRGNVTVPETQAPASPADGNTSSTAGDKPAAARADDLDNIPDFFDLLMPSPSATRPDAGSGDAPPAQPRPAPSPTKAPADAAGHADGKAADQPDDFDSNPLTRMTLMSFVDEDGNLLERKPAPGEPRDDAESVDEAIDELQRRPERRKPKARRLRNGFLLAKEQGGARAEIEDAELREIAEGIEPLPPVPAVPAEAQPDGTVADADGAPAAESDEPSFLKKARRRERLGPVVRWTLRIGTVVLAATLAGQAAYVFRNPIAAALPQARPVLEQACAHLGCRVGLPMQIDAITPIEASELQAINDAKDVLQLSVVLRNRSSLPQAWPHVELTLRDADRKPLVRRVFAPREYLHAAQSAERGIPARSEQQIRIVLGTTETRASDYEVGVFYP